MRRIARLLQLSVFGLLLAFHHSGAAAAQKTHFKVAWSIYVGWVPWDYAASSGILKKWADKYGITIELTQINDYVESINQYTAGQYDACVMTNMDMLTIPAAGGVDSTALIIGDYSNGNDGIILKGTGKKLADIKGQQVNLVELSVSHRSGDLEAAAVGDPRAPQHHAGIRFQQDAGRDPGHDGGEHPGAEGQPQPRPRAGRRLVRNHGGDAGQ
jgi:ABC-type nitrate/sulfonate/bicarbonate transport system substrate-binding protein